MLLLRRVRFSCTEQALLSSEDRHHQRKAHTAMVARRAAKALLGGPGASTECSKAGRVITSAYASLTPLRMTGSPAHAVMHNTNDCNVTYHVAHRR